MVLDLKILDESAGRQSVRQVAVFLGQHREVTKLLIQGHTNSKANDAASLALSSRRAIAVRTQLIEMGVEGERLVAIAFGRLKPIADNATAAGRALNDRVEFQFAEVNGRPSANVRSDGLLVP